MPPGAATATATGAPARDAAAAAAVVALPRPSRHDMVLATRPGLVPAKVRRARRTKQAAAGLGAAAVIGAIVAVGAGMRSAPGGAASTATSVTRTAAKSAEPAAAVAATGSAAAGAAAADDSGSVAAAAVAVGAAAVGAAAAEGSGSGGAVAAAVPGAPEPSTAPEPGSAGVTEAIPIARATWPAGVTTPGNNIETSVRFFDKNGANYLVMSSREAPDGDPAAPSRAAYLYVDDWIAPRAGPPRSPLPIGDMVANCTSGTLAAKFHEAAFAITDLDHDGIAEITFGYELSCRSETVPGAYKLIVLEDGAQYMLRGETRIDSGGVLARPGGGFEPDPPAARWPPGFLDHAKQLWQRTADDLELPPRSH